MPPTDAPTATLGLMLPALAVCLGLLGFGRDFRARNGRGRTRYEGGETS